MKSILALIALAGAAVASPLRGNVMSPRFAEVRVEPTAKVLDTALLGCMTNDALVKAMDEALDLAAGGCDAIIACAAARQAYKAAQKVAHVAKCTEEKGWKAWVEELKNDIKNLNPIDGTVKKFANTFQLFSPSLMRQCVVCVAGMPKGTFAKYLKNPASVGATWSQPLSAMDKWTENQICTINFSADKVPMIQSADKGKKATLLKAWGNSIAGVCQLAGAAVGGDIDTTVPEAMVFKLMSEEVKLSRNYWKDHLGEIGQDPKCKLDNAAQPDFTGKAWTGDCK